MQIGLTFQQARAERSNPLDAHFQLLSVLFYWARTMFIALYKPDGNSIVLNIHQIVGFMPNGNGGTSIITTGTEGPNGLPYSPVVQETAAQVYDMILAAEVSGSRKALLQARA